MHTSTSPTIVILGANGMVGHTVFNYLSKFYPDSVWGTVRNKTPNKRLLMFDARKVEQLDKIYLKLNTIDYIINCFGILPSDKNKKTMEFVNAIFPQKLVTFAEDINAKLIHISTDAVFPKSSHNVNESTPPSPDDYYGKTKLEGEPISPNAISFRTSILGFDPNKHKGLLEFALNEKTINGFSNQLWSGCTSLQLAILCGQIIQKDSFKILRKKSHIFHFAPISKVTKHDIILTFLELIKSTKKVKKTEGDPVSRLLKTKYKKLLRIDHFQNDLKKALQELITYEDQWRKRKN